MTAEALVTWLSPWGLFILSFHSDPSSLQSLRKYPQDFSSLSSHLLSQNYFFSSTFPLLMMLASSFNLTSNYLCLLEAFHPSGVREVSSGRSRSEAILRKESLCRTRGGADEGGPLGCPSRTRCSQTPSGEWSAPLCEFMTLAVGPCSSYLS